MIPHYKESPLVQKAINDMEKYLNEKHGKVQEAEQTVEVKQEVPEAPVKKESGSVEPNRAQKKEPAKGERGELKKSVGNVSQKVLTAQLRQMEDSGLLTRTVYPEVPPRVEYTLTELGYSLKPILDAMWNWGEEYQAKKL